METIFFLDMDLKYNELYIMRQQRDGDALPVRGPFYDHVSAAVHMERLAHGFAAENKGVEVFTVIPDWAQNQDHEKFSTHSCWLIRY